MSLQAGRVTRARRFPNGEGSRSDAPCRSIRIHCFAWLPVLRLRLPLILLTAGFLILAHAPAIAQTDQDAIETARSLIKADRQAVVDDAMQLSDAEAKGFWPVYHQYRTEMDKVGDGVKSLVLEYSRLYPDLPDDRARKMPRNWPN
jgi:hypothetical protein